MKPDWIAVDWGTTNLRATAVGTDGNIIAETQSDQGMSAVRASGGNFEEVLLQIVSPWLTEGRVTPIYACGMVGAKQGWQEVPYDSAPCQPATRAETIATNSPLIEMYICAGVKQEHPADVMRGEETQIAGFLADKPDFEGVICLPGTHSKWVLIESGKISKFRTFLTGELFSLLAAQSVLSHSIATEGWEDKSFTDGFKETLQAPQHFLSSTFSLRAGDLLHGVDSVSNRSRLTGMLLGLEFAGAGEYTEQFSSVSFIGSDHLMEIYSKAAAICGLNSRSVSAESTIIKGLYQVQSRSVPGTVE